MASYSLSYYKINRQRPSIILIISPVSQYQHLPYVVLLITIHLIIIHNVSHNSLTCLMIGAANIEIIRLHIKC